jgi:hypothetical protein
MEVAQGKPVAVKYFTGITHTYSAQQILFKLKVRNAELLAAADVVETAPELVGNIVAANIGEKPAGIFDRCPFQHTVNRHMEHDWVIVFQDAGIQNAGLA